jgi:hypothetical protein
VCFGDDITPATAPSSQQQRPQTGSSQNPQQTLNPANPIQHQPPNERILPPPRPSFLTSQQSQVRTRPPLSPSNFESAKQSYPHPSTGGAIPRPPLQTPNPNHPNGMLAGPLVEAQAASSIQPRMSPSELSPLKLAELNQALARQEARYQAQIAAIDPTTTPQERASRLQSLKNGHATKKSIIRRRFNVTLRMGEKDKAARNAVMATPAAGLSFEEYRASPDPAAGTSSTQMNESIPVRSSPLNAISSNFSPINAPPSSGNNQQGSQPTPQDSPASIAINHPAPASSYVVGSRRRDIPLSPVENYPPNVHKRQRTDTGASLGYTNPSVPATPQVQSSAEAGDQAPPKASSSIEIPNDNGRQSPTSAALANHPTSIAGVSTANNNQPIEILSSSESSDDRDITPRQQRRPTPRGPRLVSEGSTRGTFTAKRGRH